MTGMLIGLLAFVALAAFQLYHYGPAVTRASLSVPAIQPSENDVYSPPPTYTVPALRFGPTSHPLNVVAVITHGSPGNKEMMTSIGAVLAQA
jgi:hypothetical protein